VPNHKSAEKRDRQNKKKGARNMAVRSEARTTVKKVREAIDAGNKEDAQTALRAATAMLHSSASKGVVHKNNASRRISRLALLVNKMS